METEPHQILLSLVPASEQIMQSQWMAEALCLAIVLLVLSAILSGFETACFSLSAEEKLHLEGMHKKSSAKALDMLSNPENLVTSVIISSSIINLLFFAAAAFFLNFFPTFFLANTSGIVLQVILIGIILFVVGKMLPKYVAFRHPMAYTLFASYPVSLVTLFFYPLIFPVLKFNSMVHHNFLHNSSGLSLDKLSEALDQSDDVVTEDRKILMGIVNFSNIEVSEVMRPRMDVVAVDYDTLFPELIQVINDSGYSRIPVFSETFDNIKGILYVKDLLPFIGEKENFKWQDLIRTGYYVPETKKIKDLLQEFLDKKIHLAIVVDEYGGTEGIITLEDVLEEIVGEITDESDEIESFYSKIDDFNYIFDGKILLNDFFKIVELSEDLFEEIRGEADTLAGLILEIKGEIPPVNESIVLKHFSFTILSVDDRRIKKLKFTIDKNFKTRYLNHGSKN